MRKLGKSFSKRYNFLRLLQTAPDLVTLYNKQENAVNSIKPTRFVQLRERMGPIEPCIDVASKEAVDVPVFGPTSPNEWPMRIKYAEQIHDLNEFGYNCVWTVRIVEDTYIPMHRATEYAAQVPVKAQVKQVPNPMVVTFWPDNLGSLVSEAHRRVDPEHLPTIDERNKASFFLSDGNTKNTPQELQQCGIIPNERHLWNATFYDYHIAHLYAESVESQLRQGAPLE